MIVPKLRFSEFKSEWQIEKLGDLVTIKSGYSPSKYDLKSFGEIPFLKVDELNNCDKYQEKSRFYSDSNKDMISKDSVIFPKRGAAILNNKVRILKVPALLDSNLMALTFNPKQNPEFYYYLINKIELFKIADTSTIPQINNKHIEPYEVFTTTNEEQTKIAEFLSAVDDKISQLSRQLELLNQYKKGVMQKIFSQEIRFKNDNGEDFGEWEEVPLNQIASKVTVKNRGNKVTEVLTNSATQGIIKQSDFFDREIVSESNINGYYVVEVDDFVYNPRISVHAPVGPIKRNKITQGIMSPLYTVFRFKEGNLDFLSYFFETNFWHDYVKSVANSGARHDRMNITNSDFLEMPILLPSIQEQEKIAEFLTAIDKRIDHTTAQLTHTKQWKKGLLQQMFV